MGQHGGARPGAGRKRKADENKAKERILRALKTVYNTKDDENAIESFLVDFHETKEGKKFMAEHLLGKPTDKIDHTNDGEAFGDGPFQVTVVKPDQD